MNFSSAALQELRQAIDSLRFGKRVGTHIYIHVDGLDQLPKTLQALADWGKGLAGTAEFEFNVLKLGLRKPSLSLLSYPAFNRQGFPVLAKAATADFDSESLKITDFSGRENPPILHRKELLLPPGHRHANKYSALTAMAESYGLFDYPAEIGLLKGWRKALSDRCLKVVGHKVVPRIGSKIPSKEIEADIRRHRTALRRGYLSQPFQILQSYRFLEGDLSIFDYGCGKGDDISRLAELGISADGWDPHYRTDHAQKPADIVNLGFVINVIEDRAERDHALRESFSLAKKFLVVSALVGTPSYASDSKIYRDGYITSIGTFQKYYSPDELQNYVRGVLGVPTIAVAQSTVIAFRSEDEADKFRARRAGQRRGVTRGSRRRAAELYLLDESARDLLGAFWDRCIELGREPVESELQEHQDVCQLGLAPSAAFRFLGEKFGTDELESARESRIQDMLVEFALANFDGRVYFKHLSDDVKKDITEFFGKYTSIRNEAKVLLFSIADTERIREACAEASSNQLGYMLGEHSLQLHVSMIDSLPPILRVYIGCAVRLLGDLGRAELVKVHITSGKISFMAYDDFDGRAVPNLLERIKVNLWHRKIEFFDYIGPFAPQPLLMKSLFLADDYPGFDLQEKFDSQLARAGIFDPERPHPTREELESILSRKGLSIVDYELVKEPNTTA